MKISHKIILAFCIFYQPVMAHDFWLTANNFNPTVGDKITISAQVGENFVGETLPRINNWFVRFEQLQDESATPIQGDLGDDPLGSIVIKKNTSSTVVYQSTFDYLTLSAEKFNQYLDKMHLKHIQDQRQIEKTDQSEGREYYARYAKLLIKPKNTIADASIYKKTGLELDIVPVNSPWSSETTNFLVYFQGKPLKGIVVRAYSQDKPQDLVEQKTDDKGQVALSLSVNNRWMVNALHMVKAREERMKKADWESLWASLVFEK